MARSPTYPPKDVVREHYRRVAESLTFGKTVAKADAGDATRQQGE